MYQKIIRAIKKHADPIRARHSQRFFKTGPGEYGEGDVFLGLTMPEQRVIAKKFFAGASLDDVEKLLSSQFHEFRMIGLLILTYQFSKANSKTCEKIYKFYLRNTGRINNWDLVDVTTPRIIGDFLLGQKEKNTETDATKILYKLARSYNLWERRIAVLATFSFIAKGDFTDAINIAKILLSDSHDLIHKAVGWMLREIGKQDQKTLLQFLDKHAIAMPRTMLRYAIEKLTREERDYYLQKKL